MAPSETFTIATARAAGYEITQHDGRWYIDRPGRPPYRNVEGYASRHDALLDLSDQVDGQAAMNRQATQWIVDVTEIAQRLGRSVGAIHQARRRHVDFPEPVRTLAVGPVWWWPDIERWAAIPRPGGRPRKAR